ncbi:hypothetical protein [Streptomyces sp. PT12]|uniref:hypothetical protein n=1 Tax=Streptomyces sp. PT12 TaxID=1510197 RepID=UPI000DE2EF4D|nr:hypothetical protein [Streptomyces sp. PT12]RBM19067.1 hypothetical protein DEH69_11720 [Streptomyces sp. PT12]
MSFPRKPHINDFPALGFVPCPGDQESIDTVGTAFGTTAEVLEEVNAVLSGADAGEWRGRTAREFRRMLRDDFQPKVQDALQSFGEAHRAIGDWLVTMGDFQRRADVLEVDAAAALADLEAARTSIDGLPPEPGPFEPEPETEEERGEQERNAEERERQETAYRVAEAALSEFRDRGERLRQDYDAEGRTIAGRLQNAIDIAPNEPGLWDRIGDALGDLVEGLTDLLDELGAAFIDLMTELAPILSKIGALTGLLSSITGLLAFIPGLQFLGGVSLVLAGISMAANYLSAVGETGSFTAALADPAFLLSAASFAFGAGSFIGMNVLHGMRATQTLGNVPGVFGWAMRNGTSASALPGVMGLTWVTNANTAGLRFMDGFGNAGTVRDMYSGAFWTSGWRTNSSPVARN